MSNVDLPPSVRWQGALASLSLLAGLWGAAGVLAAEKRGTPPSHTPEVYESWPFDAKEARRRQEGTARAIEQQTTKIIELGEGQRLRLVLVPAGEFVMGSSLSPEEIHRRWPAGDFEWAEGVRPRHRVQLTRPFYLGECEVTRAQFAVFVRRTKYVTGAEKDGEAWSLRDGKAEEYEGTSWRAPGFRQTDAHPVVCVSWLDAVAFCGWLSRTTGLRFSLPTEAQWEFACRAGSDDFWPWGDKQSDAQGSANVADEDTARTPRQRELCFKGVQDGYKYTAPSAAFKPNAFGLKNMIGNVEEWCSDCYDAAYYHRSPSRNPLGPGAGATEPGRPSERATRGGTWGSPVSETHSAARSGLPPSLASASQGFRVCLSIDGR